MQSHPWKFKVSPQSFEVLLAEYPGPLRAKGSRTSAVVCSLLIEFTAALIFLRAWIGEGGAGGIILGMLVGAIGLLLLFAVPITITLDADGVEITGKKTQRLYWSEITTITAHKGMKSRYRTWIDCGCRYPDPRHIQFSSMLFEIAGDDMVDLMRRWQSRALDKLPEPNL